MAGFRVFPERIRSLVRLKFLNQCNCSRGDVRFESLSSFGKRSCVEANRESGLSSKVGGLVMKNRQLVNQMVKRGTEVVDNITNHQSPVKIIGPNLLDGQIPPCPPRVLINNNGISLFFRATPCLESRIELIEVILRSSDFLPNTDEVGSCHAKR